MARLIGFGAVAGVIGGALRVGAAFIPDVPDAAWLEALYAACDLGMMFGLIAVYLASAEKVGRAGLAAFTFALAALASLVGPDPQAFGIDFYAAGSGVFVVALAGFAVTLVNARVFTVAGMGWIASASFGVVACVTGERLALSGAGLSLGAGFVVAGVTLARSSRTAGTATA